MRPARLALLALSAVTSSCASPDLICDLRDDDLTDTTREAEVTRRGTFVLPPGDSERRLRFRVRVEGLSELGTSHARWGDSFVNAMWSLSYGPGVPAGAELPDVDLTASVILPDGSRGPSASWGPRDPWETLDIFDCNGPPAEGCCELGEPTCTVEVELAFSRADMLFPEVDVQWSSDFHAGFPGCEGEPPITLHVEELSP